MVFAASNELSISPNIIEKDYYVTITLRELSQRIDNMVFKCGTSLSKCYQIIDHFSEDIDISYNAESGLPTDSMKRKLKNEIVNTMNSFNFPIININDTRSRRNYNRYRVKYPSIYNNSTILNTEIVIETYVALLPFPCTKKYADNYLYRFLKKINRLDLTKEYDLNPFEITTQTIERTLIDKTFAICDYFILNDISRHSRHLYDIYKILNNIDYSKNIAALIESVRKERSKLSICPSSQEKISISKTLKEIIDSKVYKDDYEKVTTKLLFTP